jgi:YidC/Oxa1 family membrane protein insertase
VFLFEWLEYAVSWVLVQFHALFTALGLPEDSGLSWSLSIVCLVIVIRIALIPLFVKQIKAQRGLQTIQPMMKEIQKKYAGDRERQSAEMMKLYKETGTNPLASCLPIILQAPIFFALFQVLNGVAQGKAKGAMTDALVDSARNATIFGAPISSTFRDADTLSTQIVVATMILLMTATTFITQRQLMVKNMPKDNPMAQQQKILLYVFPLMFAVFGINFPIGVLIYWLTTNVWSMGQQFYVIRNMPSPGTDAEKAYKARQAEKAGRRRSILGISFGAPAPAIEPEVVDEPAPPVKRQQPRQQPRSKRKPPPNKPAAGKPAAGKPAPNPAKKPKNAPNGQGKPTSGGAAAAKKPRDGAPESEKP